MKVLFLFLLQAVFMVTPATEIAVGHWNFSDGKVDSSDGKFKMNLGAASVLTSDHCGSFLRITPSDRKIQSGIRTNGLYPELSPADCFRIEIMFRLSDASADGNATLVLFDNKNVNYEHKLPAFNRGIMLWLQRRGNPPVFTPGVSLGFGQDSKNLYGQAVPLEAGKIHALTFSFNRGGQAVFKLDGKINAEHKAEDREVAAAALPLSIGDRGSANYMPFTGDIFEVKVITFPKPDVSIGMTVPGRRAFIRNEKDALLELCLENNGEAECIGIRLGGSMNAVPLVSQNVGRLSRNGKLTSCIPVETRLTPGAYPCNLKVEYCRNGESLEKTLDLTILIGPEEHDSMPVILWGSPPDFVPIRQLGFTHALSWAYAHVYVRKRKDPELLIEGHSRALDDMLAAGFRAFDLIHVTSMHEKYPRVGRDGKPYQNVHQNFDATNPDGIRETCEVTENIIQAHKSHPAYAGAGINSEVRDHSRPSFSELQCKEYKQKFGHDIPQEADGRTAPHYTRLKGFPLSRVVAQDDPLLQYYTWFWKEGDGWNPLHSAMHDICKKLVKRPFKTFYDPAVRVPPIWGSGGRTDMLSHWTYAYPDPINIAASTEETFAMAAGRDGQEVANMTQIIAYRSLTAPVGSKVANPPGWAEVEPDAKYITLAPDLMRTALWTQISRRTSAIMFHGFDSLIVDTQPNREGLYRCTNHETEKVLQDILLNVVKKLGPVLKRVPERPSEVAVLESFASSIFAGRGTWGWNGWGFDSILMLLWANLSPRVIYEETALRDGFGQLRVLVMPHCDVLPRPVYEAVQKFQRQGGLIVGDEFLVPGITPDIQIDSIRRIREKPLETKAALVTTGLEIRKQLAPYFRPYVTASNPDIVTHVRSSGNADYLFVVNDKRTFGDYWGAYGLVAEKGLPNTGTVTVNRAAGAVYDSVRSVPVDFKSDGGSTTIPVEFSTSGGALFLLLPKPVGSVAIDMPKTVRAGTPFTVKARVLDHSGEPIRTIHPVILEFRNADGILTDDSTSAALENGSYVQTIIPALNGKQGIWNVTVRDLASGKHNSKTIRVTK